MNVQTMTRAYEHTVDPHQVDRLLERVAQGEQFALSSLYKVVAPKLFAKLLLTVRSRGAAEDILQEAFITIWRKSHQFDRSKGSAEAWLHTVAKRKAIDQLRREYRLNAAARLEATEPEPDRPEDSAEVETALAVRTCLQHMRPEIRDAVLWSFVHGFTNTEIADRMNVPVGTVKSWIRRGLISLRVWLEGHGE